MMNPVVVKKFATQWLEEDAHALDYGALVVGKASAR
jgi:hypothetical protein